MPSVSFLVYVHILLMVFWLGTDIGVFLAGLRFMDPKRAVAERTAVINLGMVIDRMPRICFVVIVPVGLQLAYLLGVVPLTATLMIWVWVLSALWLSSVVGGMLFAGTPRARPCTWIQNAFLGVAAIVFLLAGIGGWNHDSSIPGWLAAKLVAYGTMCIFSLLLDRSFGPVFVAFGAIVEGGSTPEHEAALRGPMIQTYVWVLAIYAAVLASGYWGTVKP